MIDVSRRDVEKLSSSLARSVHGPARTWRGVRIRSGPGHSGRYFELRRARIDSERKKSSNDDDLHFDPHSYLVDARTIVGHH